MRLLYALTVHDREEELNINRFLIRTFLPDFDVKVFCNSDGEPDRLDNKTDDGFFWCKNKDHYRGALDHTNMVLERLTGYDYVVVQAAKSIWTDYTLVRRVIHEMKETRSGIAFMNDNGGGHFGAGFLSRYCDFIAADVKTYRQVFPVRPGDDGWPECAIARKADEVAGDRTFIIPCSPPSDGGQDDFTFKKIFGTKHWMLSARTLDLKLKQLENINPLYSRLIREEKHKH